MMALAEGIFVYRYLPIDEKIDFVPSLRDGF